MNEPIAELSRRAGSYSGRGKNHEQQPFSAQMIVTPLLDDRAVRLQFAARGDDGTLFHEEETVIAPLLDGRLALFTVTTNLPGGLLLEHRRSVPEDAAPGKTLTFAAGDRDDRSAFREEISLDLLPADEITYRFAWGMPGGDFADRSRVTMSREAP